MKAVWGKIIWAEFVNDQIAVILISLFQNVQENLKLKPIFSYYKIIIMFYLINFQMYWMYH